MATYRLRQVGIVRTGKTIRPESKLDAGWIFMSRWHLPDGTKIDQELSPEEYASRRDKNPQPIENRTGHPDAVYQGGWAQVRVTTPSGRLEPGDYFVIPGAIRRDGREVSERVLINLPGVRGGEIVLPASSLDRADLPGVSIRSGEATVTSG